MNVCMHVCSLLTIAYAIEYIYETQNTCIMGGFSKNIKQ